jgi:flagellar biosynthesis/type III secretory pathway protein FliH
LAEPFEFGSLEPPEFLDTEHSTAEERLRAIAAEARRLGREQGYAEGLAEARARIEPALDAVVAAESQVRALEDEYLRRAERSAVDLALAIAEKVLGGAVAAEPRLVIDVVAGALLRTAVRHHLVIEVNPDDFELVRDAADGLAARLGGVRRLDVISERRIGRGGCVVRTEEGEIDARLDSQLDRVREVMLESAAAPDEAPTERREAA